MMQQTLKVTIIKMLHCAYGNILETNEKIESLGKETEEKRTKMEILEPKHLVIKIKTQWLGSTSRWRKREKKLVNWKIGQ